MRPLGQIRRRAEVTSDGTTGNSWISEYDATTGATINASFVPGLYDSAGLAISGNDLYVTYLNGGGISEYNATTGAEINPALVSGLDLPYGIVVANSVPEPSSWSLMLGAMALLAFLRTRKARA